jgi:hypothetical protein
MADAYLNKCLNELNKSKILRNYIFYTICYHLVLKYPSKANKLKTWWSAYGTLGGVGPLGSGAQ